MGKDRPLIRCGDIVRHEPSGEEWLVAYADYDIGYLAWAGWPEGRAILDDCVLVRACSDAEHAARVDDWLDLVLDADHRAAAVRRLYAPSDSR